jgi:hypothetical protein
VKLNELRIVQEEDVPLVERQRCGRRPSLDNSRDEDYGGAAELSI